MIGDKFKILIVDDDESIRGYISRLLNMSGFEVITASSGKDALNLLKVNPDVAVVLLDILMPDMDGLETLTEIKKASKELPVIMLSALGQTGIIVKAMRAGASDYLVKPFEEEELELAISKSIEKRKLLAEITSLKKKLRIDELKGEFIFTSPKMQKIKDVIEQVADTDVSVLIDGKAEPERTHCSLSAFPLKS
jgi:DNA-binding NtrC family response regulator